MHLTPLGKVTIDIVGKIQRISIIDGARFKILRKRVEAFELWQLVITVWSFVFRFAVTVRPNWRYIL